MKRPPYGLSVPAGYQPPGWLAALVSAEAIRHDEPYGLCAPVRPLYVHDGRTLTVTFGDGRLRFNICLLDCWSPELSEPGGTEAQRYAEKIVTLCRETLAVFVPLPDDPDNLLAQLSTLSRVLGYVFIDAKRTLNEMMVAGHHATATKPKAKPEAKP